MRLPGTRNAMDFLRAQNRLVRENNLKISEWVDDYLNSCLLNGEVVTILTQWCVSKNLEKRSRPERGGFEPTKKERVLLETRLPAIARVMAGNGFRVNWWITFNRSYLDSRRVERTLELKYKELIMSLARPLVEEGWLIFADWEDDILGCRPEPNREVLTSIERFVSPEALALEIRWNAAWSEEETAMRQSDEELGRDVRFQIACEAEEGRLLMGSNSPFGTFILIPLEVPEQYDFFAIFAKDFKKRIVAVLPPYPWRLKGNQ